MHSTISINKIMCYHHSGTNEHPKHLVWAIANRPLNSRPKTTCCACKCNHRAGRSGAGCLTAPAAPPAAGASGAAGAAGAVFTNTRLHAQPQDRSASADQ